jgi:hypothetical protein
MLDRDRPRLIAGLALVALIVGLVGPLGARGQEVADVEAPGFVAGEDAAVVEGPVPPGGDPVAADAGCPGIIVPSYFYPPGRWDALYEAGHPLQMIILNPASGVGPRRNGDFARGAAAARASGLKVLGYIATDDGRRPEQAVLAEVAQYHAWYEVDGFFLDESSIRPERMDYFRRVAAAIRQEPGMMVVMNQAVFPPDEGWAQIGDILAVSDARWTDYAQRNQVPAWIHRYPRSKFVHFVHSTEQEADMLRALDLAWARNAGYVYVTDAGVGQSNAWARLPSYWPSLLAATGRACPTAMPSPE